MSDQTDSEIDSESGKPVIWYGGEAQFQKVITGDGQWEHAGVWAFPPNRPCVYVYTTRVIRKFEGGFETINSIYRWIDDSGIGG